MAIHQPPKPFTQNLIKISIDSFTTKEVFFDGRRAVFLPDEQFLLITDLHWGKGETFRQHGIPIPHTLLMADLERLSSLIASYPVQKIIILGDLIHSLIGLTEGLQETILQWRRQNNVPMILIAGNHDRKVRSVDIPWNEDWNIEVIWKALETEYYIFSHEPVTQLGEPLEVAGRFNWCGHIHPTIQIQSPSDRIRLPCFHIHSAGCTLPAFSEFTGGMNIHPQLGDQILAISEGLVIPI